VVVRLGFAVVSLSGALQPIKASAVTHIARIVRCPGEMRKNRFLTSVFIKIAAGL
jgi:hypothetical protein